MIEESEDRVMKHCKKCDSHKPLTEFPANRQTKDGRHTYCKACDKARKAEYYTQNKAKVDARSKAWRAENPEASRETVRVASRAWRERNPEAARAWREKNAEAVREAQRAWYEKNREAAGEANRTWAKANRHKRNASDAKRHSAKLLRTPKWLTQPDFAAIEHIYAQAAELTGATGLSHEVDHIYPLQGRYVSGLHVPANLQILTASENRSKLNRWVPE